MQEKELKQLCAYPLEFVLRIAKAGERRVVHTLEQSGKQFNYASQKT